MLAKKQNAMKSNYELGQAAEWGNHNRPLTQISFWLYRL